MPFRRLFRFLFVAGVLLLGTSFASPSWGRSLPESADSSAGIAAIVLSESFDGGTLPAGWQVTGTPGWRFDNPGGRANNTGGAGNFAIADSDNAGTVPMATELRTPALNLSAASGVNLTFKTDFLALAPSTADVDVSINNGATWTNIWRQSAAGATGTVSLSVPQAVGQGSVMFRFHYYNANYAWYWLVDDVVVESTAPPAAPSGLSAVPSGSNVVLLWTDNSSDEQHFVVEQSPNGTSGWVEAGRVGPNGTTFTHENATCGSTRYYRVKATNRGLSSGYSNQASVTMPTCPPAVVGINENFNAGQSLPAGWSVPYGAWFFNRPNTTGGTGNAAHGAFGYTPPSELRTPIFSMVGVNAVLLTFQTDIKIYANQTLAQDANVEISTNGGATWITVWDKNAAYKGPVAIDLSPWAANQPSVMVRFVAILPYTDSYWQLDNVVIGAMPMPGTPTALSASLTGASEVLIGWNGSPGAKYKLERSANGGATWSQIADLTTGATSYVDTGVASFTAYQYRVRSYNAAGESSFSTPVSITTGDRSKRYIDVTISLHAEASIGTPADRARYENNIRYFADAIYEQSNGAHILRKVTFYRDGAHFDSAHVQWIASCHPNANPGGYIRPGTGARVEMCDDFPDSINFLADDAGQQGGGETLAHEWGHFFYGLYDEYQGSDPDPGWIGSPRSTDIDSSIAIMNSQWGGLRDPRKLNHSTLPSNFSLVTAQGRVFGAPGWAVLARPKNQDPQIPDAAQRPYWPELAAVAPPPNSWPQIELPNPAARASLNIVWEPGFGTPREGAAAPLGAGYHVVRELVIDRSALMGDSGHLEAVKAALVGMINDLPLGDSVGIVTYDGTTTVVQPVTAIVNQASRDELIAAVNSITAGDDQAAAGEALQLALDELTDPGVPSDLTHVVYHFTHGGDTVGTHPISVVPDYESATTPLYIFGFDPAYEDEADLRQLAELTDGEFTVVHTAANLETALTHAEHAITPHHDVTLAHAYTALEGGESFEVPVAFDATLQEVDFDISYLADPVSATITLFDPLGTPYPVDPAQDCTLYGTEDDAYTSCRVTHTGPVGNWTLQVEAATEMYLEYHITGITDFNETTYDAALSARDGDSVTYPEPIVVYATAHRSLPIAGLNVEGVVQEEDGHEFTVHFNDDGHAPDNVAGDGTYSAYVDYTEPGEHLISVEFDNFAGTAYYSAISVMRDNPDTPITELFEREAHFQVSVLDWREDDHPDWPDDPEEPPTLLTVDNVQVPGRIDHEDDADLFQVTVPMDYAEPTIGIRVNDLGLGMDPYVLVFASDYSWQFEHFLDYTPTSDDQLFFPVEVTPGETFYVEVLHYDEEATAGTYDISAGPYLWSDPVPQEKLPYLLYLPVVLR